MSRRFAIALAAVAALVPCSAASAATTRYASPTGSSLLPCTQFAPCSLDKAQQIAVSGDTVQLGAGTYGTPGMAPAADITDGIKALTFAGAPGPAPLIWNRRVFLNTAGSKLSNLDIRAGSGFNVNNLLIMLNGTSADRISVRHGGTGSETIVCRLDGNVTLTNSVCEGRRTDSAEVEAVSAGGTIVVNPVYTLRNVTAVANATNGVGIAGYATASDATVNLTNVIADGPTAGVELTAVGHTLLAIIDHSDITSFLVSGTIVFNGTNNFISIPPQFVDKAGGDFHQLASSPTVDAGLDSALNGPLDLDGLTRQAGEHTDIGAYERPTFASLCAATRATGAPAATLLCAQLNAAAAADGAGNTALKRASLNTYILTLSRAGLPASATGPLTAGARQLL